MKEYLPLGIYYIIILLLSNGIMFFLSLIFIILAIFLIIFYRIIDDEVIMYAYIFLSLIPLIFPFVSMDPYSPVTLGAMYSILSLPLYHIITIKFKGRYGKIHPYTITYYFLSLPLSFLSIYFFLFLIPIINFWILVLLILLLLAIILYLSLPES